MSRQSILLSALGGVLVIALWWLFLYSPGQEQLAEIQTEIEAAEAETVSLQQRVGQLVNIRVRAPETEAAIVRLRGLVPDEPAIPSALRQLEAAASDSGVEIRLLNTSRPTPVGNEASSAISGLHQLSVAMTFEGSYFQVVDFLRRLEDPTIVSRGIDVNSVTIVPGDLPTLQVTAQAAMFAVLDPPPALPGDEPAAPPPDTSTEDEADGTGDEEEE